MLKSLALVSLLASAAALNAQSAGTPPDATSQPAAPIVRAYQNAPAYPAPQANPAPDPQSGPAPDGSRAPMLRRGRRFDQPTAQIVDSQPISGVWLRYDTQSGVRTISATPKAAEIRLEHGRLNVNVHQPAQHTAILVDLPGGQTSLLKDGLYTFNADTNTVRVLHGEAAAFPSTPGTSGTGTSAPGTTASANAPAPTPATERGIKIKENHELAFTPGSLKSVDAYPYELAADLLPLGNGDGRIYANNSGEDGPYGYPYSAYPYYAAGWGAYDYPGYYGYGYPLAYGVGFGYYGGFRGGYGYRGGFRR